jgi:hypothetical protein
MEHQNLRLIQNVIYMSIYEATDLQKKKRTLLVAIRREISKITQLEY